MSKLTKKQKILVEKLDPEKDDGILKSPVKIVASRILKPEEFPDNK